MSSTDYSQSRGLPTPVPKRLRVAFLGGAFDSAVGRAHRAAIELDQRFELVAGCFSRNAELGLATALKYGVQADRSYANVDQLLAHEKNNLDAIVILTPQDQHGRHVVACLEAGLPVICEKALVGSVEEAIVIQDKLLSCEGFLAVTYNYTGYPILRELRQMIRKGRLGKFSKFKLKCPKRGSPG